MRDSKTCKHYKPGDCKRFNPQREYIDCGDCEDYERKIRKCGDCEHYEACDRYCEVKHDTRFFGASAEACEYFADAKEISDILRKAETVPVVTEQAETEQSEPTSPNHYKHGGIECKDCIKAALGENYIGFLIGNVIKYVYRYKHKNGVNDLEKAKVYLEWAIKEVQENVER